MSGGCTLCPRQCGADREHGQPGRCKSTAAMRIARSALHFWEEPPISGKNGSGAVFFTGCPLGCVYCQNVEISQSMTPPGKEITPQQLSVIFDELVAQGAHNLNLVTPTHYVSQIRAALLLNQPAVPVVYNTSGYETIETLQSLQGLVDVYLPDFKYAQPELAEKFSAAADYPEVALAAIDEMVRQVGLPVYDADGMMVRGVMIRHLILPGHTKNSMAALRLIHDRFPGVPVSLMAQYTPPAHLAENTAYPELSRRITQRELDKVQDELFALGLDGFLQDRTAGDSAFLPDFHQFSKPGEI